MKMTFYANLFLLFFSLMIFSQNQPQKKNLFQTAGSVIKTSFKTVPDDFVFLGKEFSNDWKKTGYYAAGILGLIATDKITTKAWQNHVESNIDYSLPNITPHFLRSSKNVWINGENSYITYPIIGLYFGSLFTNKEKGQFAAINSFKAIAYSTLITQLTLKTIFGRKRPHRPLDSGNPGSGGGTSSDYSSSPWNFFNNRGNTYLYGGPIGSAMPSMHATGYFAIAKVIQMEYDNYWIPYGLIAVVFASDITGHNHWFSDMIVGGLVGTLIGRSIVKSSWKARGIIDNKRQKKISINYTPRFSPEFTGIQIVGTF